MEFKPEFSKKFIFEKILVKEIFEKPKIKILAVKKMNFPS